MENYYNDKYNLDSFSDGSSRERRPRSSSRQKPRRVAKTTDRKPQSTRRSHFVSVSHSPKPARAKKPEAPKPKKERTKKPKTANTETAEKKRTAAKRTAKRGAGNVYRAQKEKSKAKRAMIIAASVVIVAAIAATACVVGYNIYRENKKREEFHFSEGVKLSGIDISGLTMTEAKEKIDSNLISAVPDFKLKVSARDKTKNYTKKDFTYTYSYDDQLAQLKIYSQKEQGIYEPKKGETEPSTGELKMPDLKIDWKLQRVSVKKVSKELSKEVNKSFKNAKVSKFHPFAEERFEYKKGSNGYQLDQADLTHKISAFIKSGEKNGDINAKVKTLKPEITVDDLKEKIVGLSTATSVSYNTEDGTTNMAVALKACNGSVIEPGAIWSFNEQTGDSNDPSNGYKKATVINDRKLEEGYGGGICQASTTIFKAAAFANMGIIERHNHYWASAYAYAGEDATIDYPNLDLRLRNNTDYQMFMECTVDGSTLIVNIYGVQEDYYDNVKLYSKNHDIDKKTGFSTTTYRVLYLDGKIVDEEEICNSEYSLTGDHSIRDEDTGTFRTMVDGTTQYETDPPTEPPTTEETETAEATETSETVDTGETEEAYSEPAEETEPQYEEESEAYIEGESEYTPDGSE